MAYAASGLIFMVGAIFGLFGGTLSAGLVWYFCERIDTAGKFFILWLCCVITFFFIGIAIN